jgi:hypothetical protein
MIEREGRGVSYRLVVHQTCQMKCVRISQTRTSRSLHLSMSNPKIQSVDLAVNFVAAMVLESYDV